MVLCYVCSTNFWELQSPPTHRNMPLKLFLTDKYQRHQPSRYYILKLWSPPDRTTLQKTWTTVNSGHAWSMEAVTRWHTFPVHPEDYPLRYLSTQNHHWPCQVGWLEKIVDCKVQIIPISGKANVVTDALSRNPAKYLWSMITTKTCFQKHQNRYHPKRALFSLQIKSFHLPKKFHKFQKEYVF